MTNNIVHLNTEYAAARLERKIATTHQEAVKLMQANINDTHIALKQLHKLYQTTSRMLDDQIEALALITGTEPETTERETL